MAVAYLLVLLGITLVSSVPIHSVPRVLSKAHESIVTPLNLTHPEVGSNPLFTSVIRSLNSSCQAEVLNATLDVYIRLFSSLLHQGPHSAPLLQQLHSSEVHEVQSAIKEFRKYMLKRKTELNHLQTNKEDLLSKINAIKVDDPLVQRKALAQFLEVYDAISGLLTSRDNRYN